MDLIFSVATATIVEKSSHVRDIGDTYRAINNMKFPFLY